MQEVAQGLADDLAGVHAVVLGPGGDGRPELRVQPDLDHLGGAVADPVPAGAPVDRSPQCLSYYTNPGSICCAPSPVSTGTPPRDYRRDQR